MPNNNIGHIKIQTFLLCRFHLPFTNTYEPLSLIFNYITQEKDILKNNPGQQYLHYSQKYYFDHGENDNFFFPLADTLRITEDVIGDLKEKLNLLDDVNIYNFLIPNERMVYMTKDFPDVLSRLKYPLTIFHGARGGANRDYVRAIKVSPAFIAQRQGSLLEASNVGGGGSVITLLRPGNGSNNTNATTTMVTINVEGDGGNDNCQSNTEECPERGVPLGIFIATIGKSYSCIFVDFPAFFAKCHFSKKSPQLDVAQKNCTRYFGTRHNYAYSKQHTHTHTFTLTHG